MTKRESTIQFYKELQKHVDKFEFKGDLTLREQSLLKNYVVYNLLESEIEYWDKSKD